MPILGKENDIYPSDLLANDVYLTSEDRQWIFDQIHNQNIGKKLGIEIESNQRLEAMNNNEIIKFAKKIRKI